MTTTSELRDHALAVASAVDPDVMTGEQAARAVDDLAVADKATAATLLFLAVRVARTDAWRGQGHLTAADWLAAKAGISVFEANRQLGTARRAERMPKTKERMKKGRVSPTQADAVTDAAAVDPSAEDDLLGMAERDTTKNLRDEAARRRAAATDDAGRERRNHANRSVRCWVDRDGAYNLHLRGTAADGARIDALLRRHEEQAFRTGRTDGVRDSFDNRSYDATLAALGLANASGFEPATAPAKPAGGSNTKVIVRVDHTALLRGRTVAGETCDIAGVGPVPVEAVKEILRDDPFLAVVVTKGGDVVNVAHHGRGLNAAQRTAIEATGVRCSNIACNRTIAIQIDHRIPWKDNPETKLDNQDPYCPHCHDLKTHHGHHLEPGTGRRRLLPPDQPATGPPAEAVQATLC